ncbi:MAG: copper resistance protein CopC [Mycobacterium sp.]|nr:copper resistance protein CopC [Mycobacterium sp.]
MTRRLLAAVLLVVTVALTAAPAAWAHAVLTASDPADGATLTTGPARVTATFNEQLQSAFAAMTVVGPDGNLWSSGPPEVQGATVGVALRPLGPAGRYTVNYRVTSADGHVVSGSWSFTVSVTGPGTPGPSTASAPTDNGIPVWPFLAGAVLLVVGAAIWALRRRS